MNPERREELAGRLIDGALNADEKAELARLAEADTEFAQELAAVQALDTEAAEAGSWLRHHPALTLDRAALDTISGVAARRKPRRALAWWAGGVLAAAAAVVIVVIPTGTPAPNASAPRDGAALFAQALAKVPATRIGVWETSPGTVKACLWIAEEEWRALGAADRAALITHLRAQVPAMRAATTTFAGLPATDPAYARRLAAVAALPAEAHVIMGLVRQGDAWVRSRILEEAG